MNDNDQRGGSGESKQVGGDEQAKLEDWRRDPDQRRAWLFFKIKALLVIAAVLVAANFERWNESPTQRLDRQYRLADRVESLAEGDAFESCMAEFGTTEAECQEIAARAAEFARGKAKHVYGQ